MRRIATAQFTQALKQTCLLYWFVTRRSLSDLISSCGPHQRGGWIGKASDWHVRAQGLMTRVDKIIFRTMWNTRLRSTIAMTEKWLQMSLSTSFLNGDVAQNIERSYRMWEERGSMPRISNYSEKTGNQETNTTGNCLIRSKKKHWEVRPIFHGKHLK